MVYILGVNLPDHKLTWLALKRVYGIGETTAKQICNRLAISHHVCLKDLPENKLLAIAKELNERVIETELRKQTEANIRRLVNIQCLRGIRHAAGLPVRGQRAHTNAVTARKLNGAFLRREKQEQMSK